LKNRGIGKRIILRVAVSGLLLLLSPGAAQADELSELKQQMEAATELLQQMQKRIDQLEAKQKQNEQAQNEKIEQEVEK
jgi:hypothetical protein